VAANDDAQPKSTMFTEIGRFLSIYVEI